FAGSFLGVHQNEFTLSFRQIIPIPEAAIPLQPMWRDFRLEDLPLNEAAKLVGPLVVGLGPLSRGEGAEAQENQNERYMLKSIHSHDCNSRPTRPQTSLPAPV